MISNTIFIIQNNLFVKWMTQKTLFYGVYGDIWKIAGIVLAGLCTDTQSNSGKSMCISEGHGGAGGLAGLRASVCALHT